MDETQNELAFPEKAKHSNVTQPMGWVTLLLALATLVVHITTLSESEVRLNWFHGDSLFPAHLAHDVLLEGGSLATWRSPMAPFFFPDWPLVGAVVYWTGQPIVANLAFLCLNYLVLALAVVGCNRIVGGQHALYREVWLLLSLALVPTLMTWGVATSFRFLFLPAFHGGTCAWCMVAVYLILKSVESSTVGRRKSPLALVLLASVCFLLGLSDLLTVLYLVAPITAAAGVAVLLAGSSWKRLLAPLGVAWLATLAGAKATDWFILREDPASASSITVGNMVANVSIFLEQAGAYVQQGDMMHISGLLLTLVGLVLLARLAFARKRPKTDSDRLQIIFVGYTAFSIWSIVCGIVLGCSKVLWLANDYAFCTHYWLTAIYMPFVALPFVMMGVLRNRPESFHRRLATVAVAFVLLTTLGQLANKSQQPRQFAVWDYKPDVVRQIDQIAAKYELETGFVDFWEAREIGLFSTRGVRALPIAADSLKYFYWMTNYEWTQSDSANEAGELDHEFGSLAKVDFVVTGGLRDPVVSRDDVLRWFGMPSDEIELRQPDGRKTSLMVYKQGAGEAGIESNLVGYTPALVRGGSPVSIEMHRFQSQIGFREGEIRAADGAQHGAGYLLYGPYIPLPAGRFRIQAECLATELGNGGSSHWDIGFIKPGTVEFVKLAGAPLTDAGYGIDAEFELEPTYAGVQIEFRVFFGGSGRMSVRNVSLERIVGPTMLAEQAGRVLPAQ